MKVSARSDRFIPEEVGAAEEMAAEAETGALETHAAERTAHALLVPVLAVDREKLRVRYRLRAARAPERRRRLFLLLVLVLLWLRLLRTVQRVLLLVWAARWSRGGTGAGTRGPARY